MAKISSKLVIQIARERPVLLLELNLDILMNILAFCSPQTLSALSLCCKQLYTICNTDVLWKYIIRYRYKNVSTSLMSHFSSNKSLFQHYCYYRHQLNGLWVLHLPPFNIVLRISQSIKNPLESVGLIPELRSINYFNNPIEYQEIAHFFYEDSSTVTATKNKFIFSCSGEFDCGETIKPLQSMKLSKGPMKNLVCVITPSLIKRLVRKDLYIRERLSILSKRYRDPACEINLTKVVVSQVCTAEPQVLLPGVYQGEYSAHGIELLLLYYQEDKIIVKKLTGDPNIPGDQISLRCSHINKLKVSSPVDVAMSLGEMAYELPPASFPHKFIAYYTGEGQIAFTGFYNPTFCIGRMYVADDSTFVFAWDSPLFCYGLYRRCEDLTKECTFV